MVRPQEGLIMATPYAGHAVLGRLAALDDFFARFDDPDAYVLSDDDGIGALFDEIGSDYPCDNPY